MVEVVIVLEHRPPLCAEAGAGGTAGFLQAGEPYLSRPPEELAIWHLQDLLAEGGLDQLDRKGSRGVALIEDRIDFDHFQ